MAEYVEQSVEEMLGELEEMTRVGLFTDQERRIILKKRKAFEYRLRRLQKEKDDYLQYIQYEINLLALVKKRGKKLGAGTQYRSVQFAVVGRILKLFWLATTRFKNDETMWLSYIAFSKQQGHKAPVTRIFTDMLKVLNRRPNLWLMAAGWEFESCGNPSSARTLMQRDLWLMAAGWEFESCDNPSSARTLMQRGLRFNPESQLLWIEYYKMELMLTQKVLDMKERNPKKKVDVSDAVLSGKVAQVVFTKAIEAFKGDVTFAIKLLRVCELFDFSQPQQNFIIKHIQELYSGKEETWDMLARHCLCDDTLDGDRVKIRESHKVFREAVTKLPSESMWTFYLNFCHEAIESATEKDDRNQRIETALQLYREAADNNLLSQQLYLSWIESLLKVGRVSEAESASKESVRLYPSDPTLWFHHLQLTVTLKPTETSVLKIFKKCRSSIPVKESWLVWRLMLQYLLSVNSSHLIPLLEEGSSCAVGELCQPVKEWYMEWYCLDHSPAETRHLYKQLTQRSCTSLKFYTNYLNLELAKANVKMKRAREIYEDAVRTYGSDNIDIWLEYIKMEQGMGEPGMVGHLHHRAIKTLTGNLVDQFVTRYTLLHTGHES